MGLFSRKTRTIDATDANAEVARHAASGGGGAMTMLVSAMALIFSAVSLYETVLRQPELSVYVPPVIHYTREQGGDVFAVPITIANRGARDGTVLSIELEATNGSAEAKPFYSAYFVDSGYFLRSKLERGPTGGLQITKQRPKAPFAPLTIAGRNAYTGTILFFAKGKAFPLVVTESGEYEMTVTLNTRFDDKLAWLDELWKTETKPLSFKVKVGNFNTRTVQRGDTIEMISAAW